MDTVPAPAEVHRLSNTLPTATVTPDLRLRKRQRETVPAREHLVRPLDLRAFTGWVVEDATLDV